MGEQRVRGKSFKPPTERDRIEREAYHEAGHAVMAVLVCRGVEYVWLEGESESNLGGGCQLTGPPGIIARLGSGHSRTIEREVLIKVSGMAVDSLRKVRYWPMGGLKDRLEAIWLLKSRDGLNSDCGADYMRLCHTAEHRLKENWNAVETVAKVLIRERGKRVSGRRIRTITKAAL